MRTADVLDRVLAGERVEASPEVRELAELAALLQGAWQQPPPPTAIARSRAAAMEAFLEGNGNGSAALPAPILLPRPARGRRVLVRLAVAAALVVGVPAAGWAASQDALPGEVMYPVKRAFEEVRLAFAGDPADEAEILLGMAAERLEEAAVADAFGRDDSAEEAFAGYDDAVLRFDGRIEQAQALNLPVGGLLAQAEGLRGVYEQLVEAIVGIPFASIRAEQAATSAQPEESGKTRGSTDGRGKGEPRRGAGGGAPNKAASRGGSPAQGGGGTNLGGGQGNGGQGNGGQGGGNGGGGQGNGGQGSGGGGSVTGDVVTGGGAGGSDTTQGGSETDGGGEDGKEEEPPEPSEEDQAGDEDQDQGSGSGSSSG